MLGFTKRQLKNFFAFEFCHDKKFDFKIHNEGNKFRSKSILLSYLIYSRVAKTISGINRFVNYIQYIFSNVYFDLETEVS